MHVAHMRHERLSPIWVKNAAASKWPARRTLLQTTFIVIVISAGIRLRLLGVGLSRQPVAQLWVAVQPWLLGGLILMFMSGIPLFLSESIKCLYNYAFWVKMTSLFLVLIFTFTVQRRVTQSGITYDRPLLGRVTALISLSLWFGVAGGGRWIGFS
jgi:hypothetical protein